MYASTAKCGTSVQRAYIRAIVLRHSGRKYTAGTEQWIRGLLIRIIYHCNRKRGRAGRLLARGSSRPGEGGKLKTCKDCILFKTDACHIFSQSPDCAACDKAIFIGIAKMRRTRKISKKILPQYFKEVLEGTKTFEIRKDEDNIKPGDWVTLKEWDGEYTGRVFMAQVSYVLRNVPEYGLKDGYCIFCWR